MTFNRRAFLKASGVATLTSTTLGAAVAEDPILALTDRVKDVPPPPLKEFEARLDKARRLMTDHQVEALFVEGGSSLEYFTGVPWGRSERMFGVIIPRQGAPVFVSPAFEQGRATERILFPGADLRVWQEHESPYQLVAKALADRNVRAGKVAVEPTTRLFLVTGLSKAAPGLNFVDGQAISDGCRMVKSKLEVEYMRLANEITKMAYAAALSGLKEGMTPSELGGRVSQAHSRLGAPGGALVLFGPASAFPHGTKEARRLQEGDVVLIDGGCQVHSYSSDVTRTTVFGRPSEKQRDVWRIVKEAQEAALATAKPGLACQEVDRAARRVIQKAGYGPGYKYFTHRLGHGIGLDGHESPYLVEGNTLKLEPGMTFSDEPGIYILGEFGIRHEDIMVITEDGAEFLGEKTTSIERAV